MRLPKPKKEIASDEWLLTYSDLMTLLLVFFVLLFSFSQIDVIKFKRFVASFQGQGVLDSGSEPLDYDSVQDSMRSYQQQNLSSQDDFTDLEQLYEKTVSYVQDQGLSDKVQIEIRYQERSVALDIKEKILFDSGKAVLKPQARELLDRVSGLFAEIPNQVSVEGHTDNRTINTFQYPTNWELSVDRAVKVVRYLTEERGLTPERFVAVGYGEYHPVVPNNSPENQAINRRVVLVMNTQKGSSEVPLQ